jgi:hypothetical protein
LTNNSLHRTTDPACEVVQEGFFLRFVNALQFSAAFSWQMAMQHSQETD